MRASKNYLKRVIAGETILIPSGAAAQQFNGLVTVNALGAFLWEALQNETDLETLVAKTTEEYEVDEATAKADVEEFLADLRKLGALED